MFKLMLVIVMFSFFDLPRPTIRLNRTNTIFVPGKADDLDQLPTSVQGLLCGFQQLEEGGYDIS